ncbi:MAG: hypothetical protein KA746_09715 [Pyrinomonadaceae bacterium]|nr:hypothetical protein [Pyrinomonadaceae bacterium]MBP6212726.1 hypothetical protein [Pyrinomonadaceae bacterium]
MLISIFLISIIAYGGLALTYLVTDEESFMWRLAVGNVAGSAIFGLVGFLLALGFGLNAVTVAIALAVTAAPLILLTRREFSGKFKHDWAKAKGKFQGGTLSRFTGFGFYAFFALVFWLFFNQTMYETGQGIFTGGSNNLGDLPFHLGAIFGFTEGNNFPPQNPSFAGAKFSYPFIADFLTACFVKLGADVKDAMFLQNFSWAFSLLVVLERFTARVTGSKFAGRIAPWLLFFSGGLGFLWFVKGYFSQTTGIWEFLWHLPQDYTIGDKFRWGNSMVVLFITQRSLLLGMPITIVVLGYLWSVFVGVVPAATETEHAKEKHHKKAATVVENRSPYMTPLLIGLLAGTLPLIHLHSLIVLFIVTGFLFIFRPEKWREWVAFGVGVCVIAVPALVWSLAGSASETSKFIGWHFGWDKRDDNVLWFWLKNTGLVFPAIAAGIYLLVNKADGSAAVSKGDGVRPNAKTLLLFYIPFVFLFVVSNVLKLAPWEWDNIKVLIYWFVGSLPLIAYAIAWGWQKSTVFRVVAVTGLAVLTFSGGLDVWRTATGQNKIRVFETDAIRLAEQIKGKTPPDALFLNAPTYNSAIVLSGRRSFIRYVGHLSSHGIDYREREEQTRKMYEGAGVSEMLLGTNEIEYVLVSPEERSTMAPNEDFFRKYPVIAESGQYRVYKIK